MTSFLTFALSRQPKMYVISNAIVILLFLNELSSNLVKEVKIKKKENCKHIYSSKTNFLYYCYKREKLGSDFGHFLAKHVLKIGLPWQQLRFLVTKKYAK